MLPRPGRLCVFVLAMAGAMSATASPDPSASSVDLAPVRDLMRKGDFRVLAAGDSFSAPNWARVSPAITRIWPYGTLTAVCGGASPDANVVQGVAYLTPSVAIQADYYVLFYFTPEWAYFSLPVRGIREFYFRDNITFTSDNHIIRILLWNGAYESTSGDWIVNTGDRFAFRMLYWGAPPSLLASSVVLDDPSLGTRVIDLQNGARGKWSLGETPSIPKAPDSYQINAAARDYILVQTGSPTYWFGPMIDDTPEGLAGTDTYFQSAGGVFYKVDSAGNRVPGPYYSYLADNSWSYSGFAYDQAAIAPADKHFSTEQLIHWLDVTTLDRSQPLIVFYYIAAERVGSDGGEEKFTSMIDRFDEAAQAVGIQTVRHVLVLPHFHSIGGVADDSIRSEFEDQRDAMFRVASERSNVSAASIYDATDGILFDGSAEAQQWLADHGYDNFDYGVLNADLVDPPIGGSLLDGASLHPGGFEAAAFFAQQIIDMIESSHSTRDLNGDGCVNVFDFALFVPSFGANTGDPNFFPPADFDGSGLVDVLDFAYFIGGFGCTP